MASSYVYWPTLTYYAIERGKEGDKPRTLHETSSASHYTMTLCGLPTENAVSIISEADTFCPTCYPEESDHG